MRLVKSFVLGCAALVGVTATAVAQSPCPQCGRIHGNSQMATSNGFQAQAEAEARAMASRRHKGHIQGTVPGVNFCGVGWSSGSTPSTCTPSSNMTLVADATVRGSDGFYRVRYWR